MSAKPVVVLTATCLVWGVLLGITHVLTKDKIVEAERAEINKVLSEIFPSASFVEENGYYRCIENGKLVGYAAIVEGAGYGGKMKVAVGIYVDNTIRGVRVVSHSETPGLGSRVAEDEFLKQFEGKTLERVWLKSDGGDIDAITGATISSRAVVEAVRKGMEELARRFSL